MKSDMLDEEIFFLTSQFRISLQSWPGDRRFWMTHSMSKTELEWILMTWAIDLEDDTLWFVRSMIRSCSVPFISSLDTTMSSFLFPPVQANTFSGLLWWSSAKNTDWVLPLAWKDTSTGRTVILSLHWHCILDLISLFTAWNGLSWMMISACWLPLTLWETCWRTWGSSSILSWPNTVIDPSARFDGKVDSANSFSLKVSWDTFPLFDACNFRSLATLNGHLRGLSILATSKPGNHFLSSTSRSTPSGKWLPNL